MTEIMHIDTVKARMDAETVFARPLDIVSEIGLTRGQKLAALDRWEQSLKDRLRASGEGMTPPTEQTTHEAGVLEEIAKARQLLDTPV